MRFFRRDGTAAHRFIVMRVSLFFLAAGLWVGGLMVGSRYATGVAIGVVVLAVILGLIGRRSAG